MMRHSDSSRRRLTGFSLVELLAVIAIIVLMVGITQYAIGGGEGMRLTTGGHMTIEVIDNARQTARAKNTMTMVALVNNDAANLEKDRGRLMTTLAYTGGTANGGWTQVDQWRVLPVGILVDQSTPPSEYLFNETPTGVVVKRGTATVAVSSIRFLPDGRPADSLSQPRTLTLKSIKGNTKNYFTIVVNDATGIPKALRP